MEPIIEVNWTSLLEVLVIIAFIIGVGIIVIRSAVAYSKKLRGRDI